MNISSTSSVSSIQPTSKIPAQAPPVKPSTPAGSVTPTRNSDQTATQNYQQADFNPVQDTLPSQNTTTFYVNGIRTPEHKAEEARDVISDNLGMPVELLYNPTEGLLQDGFEAWKNLSGLDTQISQQVQNRFQAVLDKGENLQIFAHSQGSAITSDALRNIAAAYKASGKSEAEVEAIMGRVNVVGFGGFADHESFPEGVNVSLQRNKEDHIPQLATASLAVGNAFEAAAASPRSGKKWLDFGKAVVGGIGTVGKTVVKNGAQAVGSAFENRSEFKKAFQSEQINMKQLEAYFAKICATVESDHTVVVCDQRGKAVDGYLKNYFEEKAA